MHLSKFIRVLDSWYAGTNIVKYFTIYPKKIVMLAKGWKDGASRNIGKGHSFSIFRVFKVACSITINDQDSAFPTNREFVFLIYKIYIYRSPRFKC